MCHDGNFELQHYQNNYFVLNPKEHKYSMIFLHGLGDKGQSFIDLFVDHELVPDTCKVILPTAPIQACTVNGGARMTSWFDILTLGELSGPKTLA